MTVDVSPTLKCPHCKQHIHLTESLAAPLIEAARAELEERAQSREKLVAEREHQLSARLRELEVQRGHLDEQIAEKLRAERATLVATEAKKARAALADEIARTQAELGARDELLREQADKLAAARDKEVMLLKAQRELEDQKASLTLDVERKLSEERGKLRDEARRSSDEENRLNLAAKDKTISDMQRQVEELRRRAEQGSQQLQGEVLELEIEGLLRSTFPIDGIEAVAKGVHGGDVVHRVIGHTGQVHGTILWELKRTKSFVAGWLPTLRDNQRAAKADLAILVSEALPKEIAVFGLHEGVWITAPKTAIALALCLRQLLVEVAAARTAGEGLETKMAIAYQYLTGPRFQARFNAIIEAFSTMKTDLDKERKVLTKQWAKRDAELQRALIAAAGMYGDLQGIAGKSLLEIESLELRALEAPASPASSDSDDASS